MRNTGNLSISFTSSDPSDSQLLQDSKSKHKFSHEDHNPLSTSTEENDQDQHIGADDPDCVQNDGNPFVDDFHFRTASNHHRIAAYMIRLTPRIAKLPDLEILPTIDW